MAGHHGKGHHAGHCVYGSIVKQKKSVDNNSHPQIPDDEMILASLFKANGRKDSQLVSKHAACLNEAAELLQKFSGKAGELKENGEVQVYELRKIHNCILNEHYVQTLLAMEGLEEDDSHCINLASSI